MKTLSVYRAALRTHVEANGIYYERAECSISLALSLDTRQT